ncbi:formate dehydrogenase accessory sulfurtransferase FdhD [Vibrio sp. ABG19]|uniref:formate dehydrogenase accessory sulfurtransferase FdhD n=1 Tax=Vibrio sp. ABG19 TaxID=2817385 RepID=UPI00249E0AE2|nr:formate dehydrogenase accessory sulfurtransferase FdhD [Vibrio sp. ABG19]WGY45085.1 formate dehydrogenase accessory sulfurtransferase FdhD [Vibrio sp. ABG19]
MPEKTANSSRRTSSDGISRVYRQRFDHETGLHIEHDPLAIEEPLQISLQWQDPDSKKRHSEEWSVTMRTPGDDAHLIRGLLYSQQVIMHFDQILAIELADDEACNAENHWLVTLDHAQAHAMDNQTRRYISQSSCGVCGVTSMRALSLQREISVDNSVEWLDVATVSAMPELLSAQQPLFAATGAVHGAGYFADGKLIAVAEDVGRHNAVDKLIGRLMHQQLLQPQGILVLSGRVSFELMQKAAIAGIAVVVAVGAPSRLAVDMARQFDMTLIGFTKRHRFNIYHGHTRLRSVK